MPGGARKFAPLLWRGWGWVRNLVPLLRRGQGWVRSFQIQIKIRVAHHERLASNVGQRVPPVRVRRGFFFLGRRDACPTLKPHDFPPAGDVADGFFFDQKSVSHGQHFKRQAAPLAVRAENQVRNVRQIRGERGIDQLAQPLHGRGQIFGGILPGGHPLADQLDGFVDGRGLAQIHRWTTTLVESRASGKVRNATWR